MPEVIFFTPLGIPGEAWPCEINIGWPAGAAGVELARGGLEAGAATTRIIADVRLWAAAASGPVLVCPDESVATQVDGERTRFVYLYVLETPAHGGTVHCGMRNGVSRHKLEEAFATGDLEAAQAHMQSDHVEPGDALFIPGGKAYCIPGGLACIEIAQADGTVHEVMGARPEAIRCVNFMDRARAVIRRDLTEGGASRRVAVIQKKDFQLERLVVLQSMHLPATEQAQLFVNLGGSCLLELDEGLRHELQPLQCVQLPGRCGALRISPENGGCAALVRVQAPETPR